MIIVKVLRKFITAESLFERKCRDRGGASASLSESLASWSWSQLAVRSPSEERESIHNVNLGRYKANHVKIQAPTYFLPFLSFPCGCCCGIAGLVDTVAVPIDLHCLTAESLSTTNPLAMIALLLVLERSTSS